MSAALDKAVEAFRVAMDEETIEAVKEAMAVLDEVEVDPDEEGQLGLLASGLMQLLDSLETAE